MILNALFEVLLSCFGFLVGLVPQLPQLNENITSPISFVIDLIRNNIQLLNLFIPLPLILSLIPLCLVISNFNKFWSLINWIWCHIPVFNSSK